MILETGNSIKIPFTLFHGIDGIFYRSKQLSCNNWSKIAELPSKKSTKEIEKQRPRIAPWPKESESNGHGLNGGQRNRKAMSTDQTVAKEIEKQRPRIKRWPKKLKSNVHGSNRGQKNRKATATDQTVAKEIEKQGQVLFCV